MRNVTTLTLVILLFVTSLLFAGDKANFTGNWLINEDKSQLDDMGMAFVPAVIELVQDASTIKIKKIFQREYEDDMEFEETVTLDGKKNESEFWNSPRVTVANWSEDGKKLTIKSDIEFNRDGQVSEMTIKEIYSYSADGKMLSVENSSSSEWGDRDITLAFDREAE